ncbi:MAG: response regulator [Myxococcota bacterium]
MAEASRALVTICRRLRLMGLEVTELEECAVATLPLGPEPFEAPDGSFHPETLRFSTVGSDRIKCLSPEPLFQLPWLSIRGCSAAADIEVRVRKAWAERQVELSQARAWLEGLGGRPQNLAGGALLGLPLELEEEKTCAVVTRPGRLVLPGRGPLSGLALQRAADRVYHAEGSFETAVDLELAVTTRLEELARLEGKRARMRAQVAARTVRPSSPPTRRSHTVLLAGPQLAADGALVESLHLRGYTTCRAPSMRAALAAFGERSFQLVMVDAALDRAEGTELVPELEALPGLACVPVLVVDDRARAHRRKAARRVGAAGYLVRPISVERIEDRLRQLLDASKQRRFTRYPRRLAVRFAGGTEGAHTAVIGRGGMGLRCQRAPAVETLERFEISIPETRGLVRVEGEIVYQELEPGEAGGEVGVRFEAFPPGDERTLVAWLSGLREEPAAIG